MTRPPILDELGRELVRAARAAEAAGPRGGARYRAPRALVVGLLTLLGLAAAAAAASLILGHGDPMPGARAGDVPLELRPVAGSARLNGLNVPDPDGGPAWDVRTSRSRTGAVCATVGQVLDGELGLLGLDRRFRALPAGAADTCSTPQRTGATLAGARAFRGGGRLSALTVVNGVAAPGVHRAVAVAGGRSVAMALGRGRAFLAVFRGLPEELRPRVVLTDAAGARTTLRFADGGELIAGDPSGGTPWALQYRRGAPGLRCVAAQRAIGPDSPPPSPAGTFNTAPLSVPPRCAPAGSAFVAIRRFVPRAQRTGNSFWWGLNPARTVVWGAVPAGAGPVVLQGAGAPRPLRVDPGRGGFLAVLDGHVDPRALRVTVGGVQPRAVAVGTKGQPLAPARVPAWRSVASVARRVALPDPYEPLPGSVQISRRATDPTGGPRWALRTWATRIARAPRGLPEAERRLRCFVYGVARGGQLVMPRAGGTSRIVRTGDAFCTTDRALAASHQPVAEVRTFVDDPDAPDPRPTRIVVAGLAGDAARSALLLGAGAPLPLALGRHGTFLVVLGPEHAGAALRVRQTRAGGATSTTPLEDIGIACKPGRAASVRVADPDGGPSWTTGTGTVVTRSARPFPMAGGACQYTGRLVGGRLASIPEGELWLRYGQAGFSGTRRPGPSSRRPLQLQAQGQGFGQGRPDARSAPVPSPAQVARRTLPGRTVLAGVASSAVTSITLRTPRDVRTVRPAAGGAFIAVYDGAFYRGEIRATAHLRDGRAVTQISRVSPF